ncbi:mechanosensitive ion channel family protein [Cardiobacteriaceae bacterium TAE3-ERU3]|nr:mechanosensitive ion channel family protein [Cardiobacteriaceae bacterium TAE3-ERU3]
MDKSVDKVDQTVHHQISYLEHILLGWQKSILDYLPQLALGIITLIVFVLLAKIAKQITLKIYHKSFKTHPDIGRIVANSIYSFFLVSGIFLTLQVLGLEQMLTKLLAGAGIVGIIAGFAFKDVASNLFAGLLLKVQRPFKPDNWVEIDGNYGVIVQIGWITTVIHTVAGQEVFIPNQVIYSNSFTNYSTYQKRRIILSTGVSYGDDLETVKKAAIEEVQNIPGLLTDDAIDFYYTEIGGYSYNFELRFWIKFRTNNDYRLAMSDIIMRVKKRFEQENIDIAYPVTTLDFGVKGGVNVFDRPLQISEQNTIGQHSDQPLTPPPSKPAVENPHTEKHS